MFSPMLRADQRRWAEVYLRGLLLADGKKSVRRIADSVRIFRANQSLQQFINQSPWEWQPVRALIAKRVEAVRPPAIWLIERLVIPKRGDRSVGVQRRFVPEVGRTVNSQLALSVALVSDSGSVPVNWRIALANAWSKDADLRRAAYIPDSATGKPEWAEVSDMVDEMATGWRLSPAPIVGDVRHLPDAMRLLSNLARRGMSFCVQVEGSFPVVGTDYLPLAARHEATALPVGPQALVSVQQHLGGTGAQLPRTSQRTLPGLDPRRTRIVSSLARIPLPKSSGNGATQIVRVTGELSGRDGLSRFWVTNMTHQKLDDVMALTRLAQHSRREVETGASRFGLRDFEGRSYPGLHHHLTMVSAAFGYTAIDHESALDDVLSS
ncbi:IS701 family transposase [Kitasatospora sp. NPDC052896]|uniref:IS701 family transposase n=1 Tax=Kitasatospora sp. NPDC052896 TaxID=3364061 RepID=UPI0037CBB117